MRDKITKLVESKAFSATIVVIIVLNAIVLGVQTADIPSDVNDLLEGLDNLFLAVYVVELALKLYAWRGAFFKDGWNVFDFVIILLSLIPSSILPIPFQAARIIRLFRALRVLMVVSALKRMQIIIDSIIKSLPSVGWTLLLLVVVSYVFALGGVTLYGDEYPQFFGNLGTAAFTLFQLATLEGWPDVARTIIATHPSAWIFFVSYVLLAAFIVMNVIVGIIVDSLQKTEEEERIAEQVARSDLVQELTSLREQIRSVEEMLARLEERQK